jgi:dTDP-4-amino-4,6-dideoxygalactose transaminase
MINLFNINNYTIDTSNFNSFLSDPVVEEFENEIASYVGAKYACSIHSATMAIFLCLLEQEFTEVEIPTIIPPVVPNAILCAGHSLSYRDDIDWVGSAYTLHKFSNYKIIDSAQQLSKDQFKEQANKEDLMIFSFYPTKPVGSIDGGMIVSDDKDKIDRLKILSRYGMTTDNDSWKRKIVLPGWKMYMNSIQAQVGLNNFHKLEEKEKRLREIREEYNSAFNIDNVSSHLYRLRVDDRDQFINTMQNQGIQCGVHYSTVHNIDCYRVKNNTSLDRSNQEAKNTVSIPFNESLTDEQVKYIIDSVKNNASFI